MIGLLAGHLRPCEVLLRVNTEIISLGLNKGRANTVLGATDWLRVDFVRLANPG